MKIFISKTDFTRLSELLISAKRSSHFSRYEIRNLQDEMNKAEVVEEIPEKVVRMGSKVKVAQQPEGRQTEVTIVFPEEADMKEKKLSIFAPLATAILGYREGDRFSWGFPNGIKTLEILKVE